VTPNQLVERILAEAARTGTPAPAQPSRRDTFKVGDPNATITGVATTGFCTFDVMKRCVAQGRNFIIPHEHTFYRDNDIVTDFVENDPLYLAKLKYAQDHGLVVWRNHDLVHRQRPDDLMLVGLMRQLEWKPDKPPYELRRLPVVTLPQPMTLEQLSRYVVVRVNTQAHRVAGDPKMMVRKVAVGVGAAFPSFTLDPEVDVLIGGETAEGTDRAASSFDLTAYALDSTALGRPRGVIILNHMGTEDIGMQAMAEWIQSFTPEVSVAFVPTGEPFGRPI
jgi:putative NIF3 family GTP cyclohydrolase 1 type 2